jgi:phosphatidylglycerophosphatase A
MIKNRIAKTIATSFGFGYAPFGPGTFGTALGLIVYVILAYAFGIVDTQSQTPNLDLLLIGLVVIFTSLGTWSARILESEWGHDPGKIVIDETIGVWITILFIPFSWINVLLAFVIFRFFDILKPLGIRAIDEKLHSPFSVMLDDIVAGIYSAITLQVIVYFFNT